MKLRYCLVVALFLTSAACKRTRAPDEAVLASADGGPQAGTAPTKLRLLILSQEIHADGIPTGQQVDVSGGFLFCNVDQPTACLGNTNRWVWNNRTVGERYTSTTGDGGYIPIDTTQSFGNVKPFDGGRVTIKLNIDVSAGLLWSTRSAEFVADATLADFAGTTIAQPRIIEMRGVGSLDGYVIEATLLPQ